MSFEISGLYQVGPGGNAPRLWMYNTADVIATVIAVDYFLPAINELQVNDVIFVISSNAGTPAVTITYVNENAAGVIDVVDGLLVQDTDT